MEDIFSRKNRKMAPEKRSAGGRFKEVKVLPSFPVENVSFSGIEIICGIIQRLSGRTNRYTLRTFSRRMFYLSNASKRRDEDRKEGGTYVRSDLWGQHLTAFCSLLHQRRCYVGRQFRPFLPPSSSSSSSSRPISIASVITNPQLIPRG